MTSRGAFLLTILGAGLCAATAVQAETVLRFNRWLPPKHYIQTEGLEVWAKNVEEATKGRVKVEFTTSSLGAPPRQYDLAAEGVVDIAWGVQGYTPGRFLTAELPELPFLTPTAEALGVANWRVYKKYLEKAGDYSGVKLLALHVHGPGQIMSTSKEVRKVADLRNVKIRIPNPATSAILDLFGGVPVSAPMPKAYELLSKGVIDGTFMTSDAVEGFNLGKFCKYWLDFPGGIYNTSFFIVMNKNKWNSLSAEDQKAIDSVSGEHVARLVGKLWDVNDKKGYEILKQEGTVFTKVEGAEFEAVKAKLAHIETEWLANMKKKGIDGEAALKMLREEAQAYQPR